MSPFPARSVHEREPVLAEGPQPIIRANQDTPRTARLGR
jgi:hypothetical protein